MTFGDEDIVGDDVFEVVNHHDAIEAVGRQREARAIHHADLAADEAADRLDGFRAAIGAGPGAAALAQEQADDAVIAADVEAVQTFGGAEQVAQRAQLRLLEQRKLEQAQGPVLGRWFWSVHRARTFPRLGRTRKLYFQAPARI